MREYNASRTLRLRWQAAAAFADHRLLGANYWKNGARWLIGQKDRSEYRTEVIAGYGGSLVVHGDIDVCRFAHYGDKGDAWHRLCWMAYNTDLDYYVMQKAVIGTGPDSIPDFDTEAALDDLARFQKEIEEEEDESRDELLRVLKEAREHTESKEEMWRFIHEHDKWDLWECRFGEVVPAFVVYAHAALHRTACLLEQLYGPEGPWDCQ